MRASVLWFVGSIAACGTFAGLDALTFDDGRGGAGGTASAGGAGGAVSAGGAGGGGAAGGQPLPRTLFFFSGSLRNAQVVSHHLDERTTQAVSCAMDGALLRFAPPSASYAIENDLRGAHSGAFRAAFASLDPEPGTIDHPLLVVDANSSCDAMAPTRVDLTPRAAELPIMPRFSPDGSRIAYLEAADAGNGTVSVERLVTVGVDGNDARVIRTSSDIPSGSLFPAPPAWEPESGRLAWVEQSTGEVRVQLADDEQFAGTTDIFTCPSTQIATLVQVELFVAGGEEKIALVAQVPINAGGTGGSGGAGGLSGTGGAGGAVPVPPRRILVVNANADCDALGDLFAAEPQNVIHQEVAVSPDGQVMAHSSSRQGVGIRLWLSTIDGDDITLCDPASTGDQDWGAVWLDGGDTIAWTRAPTGSTTGAELMIADVEGTTCTNVRALLPDAVPSGESRMLGRRGTCSFVEPLPRSPMQGWLAIALLGLAAASRRQCS